MTKGDAEGLSNFETLVEDKKVRYDDRWHPISIQKLEYAISQGLLENMNANLRKNIAYSLQYLQFIQLQFDELILHSVITTMLYKTFIITGVSIIEGVFYHLLKSNNLWRQKEWELEKIVTSNPIQLENESRKFETHIFKKIPKLDDEMNLDSMIKKIEGKKLIDIPHQAFPYIKKLKRLRNKVHLQINEHPNDTDWYSFNKIDYIWMKYILYIILTNSKFGLDKEQKAKYYFLKINKEELQELKEDDQKEKAD